MASIDVNVNFAPLPEGFQGTPDDLIEHLNNNQTVEATGDQLTGQIGGAEPTENIGLWISGRDIYTWDENQAKYVPITTVPIGAITPYCGTTAPTNYLLCIGQSIAKADYVDLYNVIGDTFKRDDDASDNFRLPDMRGRHAVGAGEGDYNAAGDDVITGKLKELTFGDFIGREWLWREATAANAPSGGQNRANITSDALLYNRPNITSSRSPSVVLNWIIKAK